MAPPEERFIDRVCQFCDFFKGVLEEAKNDGIDTPASPFLMDVVKNFVKKEDPHAAITTFILRSYKSWGNAVARDKNYFRTDALSCFAGIPSASVDSFNGLFDLRKSNGELLINEETQNNLWDFFDSLIKTSIVYIHHQRKPDPETKKYTQAFFPEISVKNEVARWKITSME